MNQIDLRAAVNRHSWAWLFDLPRRLNVAVEIVDQRYVPMLPVGSGHTAATLRRLLMTAAPSLRSAISNVPQSSPQAVAVDGELCVCFALAPAGVLILAREVSTEGEPAEQGRHDLEFIGSWLGGAIEANLASDPNGAGEEQHRIASLQRLLDAAVSHGSVRDVVSAFAEALAVWLDIEVRGYVAGACGRFFQHVSLVGADPSAMSAELDDAAAPADAAMVRLSRSETERLGLVSAANDVLVRRISTQTGASWLMVFAGTLDAHDEARLTVYSDLLRESLNDLTAATTTRVVAAIVRHLSLFDVPVEATAKLALDEVIASVGARDGALVATADDGTQALAVGNTDTLPGSEPRVLPDRLAIQSAHDGGLLVLAVTGEGGRFTAHDRGILEAAAAVLNPWLRGALRRSGQGDRRRTFPTFHDWIDRLAAQTVQTGGHASVILISIRDMTWRPERMQAQVAKIRDQLRPWDFAGILTGSEIAVLLRDAPPDHAAAVSARVKKLLTDDEGGEFIRPSIGMICCSAESPCDGSIVRAAREDAAAR